MKSAENGIAEIQITIYLSTVARAWPIQIHNPQISLQAHGAREIFTHFQLIIIYIYAYWFRNNQLFCNFKFTIIHSALLEIETEGDKT